MSGQNLFYILDPKRLEPASSAEKWLGRIVKSYEAPSGRAFTPADPTRFTKERVGESSIADIEQAVQASQNRALKATLTEIFSISGSSEAKSGFDFKSSAITTKRLENYEKVFHELKQDPEVQQDLKNMLSMTSPTAYMIVGLLIWTDATFEESRSKETETSAKGKLPGVSAAVKAHSGMSLNAGDPEIEASSKNKAQVLSKGSSPGSNIFAFEYKAVRGRFYSLMANFAPTLEDYGPRVKGDKVFSHEMEDVDKSLEKQFPEQNLNLEMDEPDVFWTDTVGKFAPSEEDFGGIIFAFSTRETS